MRPTPDALKTRARMRRSVMSRALAAYSAMAELIPASMMLSDHAAHAALAALDALDGPATEARNAHASSNCAL